MEDVPGPVPVRERHLDDLASVRGDDIAELPDALSVRPITMADGHGPLVEPDDVAALERARIADLPGDRPAARPAEFPDRLGLFPPERLPHAAEDRSRSGATQAASRT